MDIDIVTNDKKRFVIIGGGFAGLEIARRLVKLDVQVVLIDRHNYHQFQPLFYQVATAGLEASSIVFPFRRNFQRTYNILFRLAEVHSISAEDKIVQTSVGPIPYDSLVIATGATNNFFGNAEIEEHALAMKSIVESLRIRNQVLEQFEKALSVPEEEKAEHLTVAIAGAGPTGVELAGSIAEMKRFILPKEYQELNFDQMRIVLIEGAPRVLGAMKEKSSWKAKQYLEKMGVEVMLNKRVKSYNGSKLVLSDDTVIRTRTLIWAAGIKGNFIPGIPEEAKMPGNRIAVNQFNQIVGMNDAYAVGDVANMKSEDPAYPEGHPQLAQVAIQQGYRFVKNMKAQLRGQKMTPFKYKNLGTMATIGRNKAVVELPRMKFYGFFAWMIWMLVHLRSILGVRNKFIVFLNWVWNYFTYNLSLRVIIKDGANRER